MDWPKISVITVVFNGATEIEATIRSVIDQQYPNLEYIIIDGASKDGTQAIIERYSTCLAYWHSKPDRGIYDAMNQGLAVATGDLVAFKNVGDHYLPNALNTAAKAWVETKADIVYGNTYKRWSGNSETKSLLISNHQQLKQRSLVDHRSAFVKRAIHRPFNLNYKLAADYDLFCEFLKSGRAFYHTHQVLSEMTGGGASDTDKIYKEIYAIQSQYFGTPFAVANLIRLRSTYWILKLKNGVLMKLLGQDGYARFKARKNLS